MNTMIRLALDILLLVMGLRAHAQSVTPVQLAVLPDSLQESSGLEAVHANNLWTHNDSGDEPRIFQIDNGGQVLRTLYLALDSVVDCEDMTRDDSGFFYLGDMGNNNNDRRDLRIYKFPDPENVPGDTVPVGIIAFQYPDQYAFPPASGAMNFDCEAMFHYRDSLYLFSKNRGTSSWCRMYRIPDQPGTYTAELIDSVSTPLWITSADISPTGHFMALLSETRLQIFTQFTGCRFFSGSSLTLTMPYTQKEAVVFVDDSLVYLTDEYLLGSGGRLYSLDLRDALSASGFRPLSKDLPRVVPNPASRRAEIVLPPSWEDPLEAMLINAEGLQVHELHLTKTRSHRYSVDLPAVPAGLFIIRLLLNDGRQLSLPVTIIP